MQNGEEGKLDRVRELLYGAHAREQEGRLSSMQGTLRDEIDRLEQEMRERLVGIEERLRGDIRELGARLDRESKLREESMATHRRELGETLAAIDDRLSELTRKQTAGQDSLGARLDEARQVLEREIEERTSSLDRVTQERIERLRDAVELVESRQNRRLDSVAGELRHGKVDRTALSTLLNELALAVSPIEEADADGDPS